MDNKRKDKITNNMWRGKIRAHKRGDKFMANW